MAPRSQWDRLRLGMDLLAKAVGEEILRYPAPIAGCDAQYNLLLELRQLLPMELARLEIALESQSISVAEFVQSSPCRETLSALLAKPARR